EIFAGIIPEKTEIIFLRGGESRSDMAMQCAKTRPSRRAIPLLPYLPTDKGRRNETRGSDASERSQQRCVSSRRVPSG
ncbi:MAG: hypothetical protein ACI4MK_04745, partial [Aristaeellaceae bacterium]